MHTVSNEYPVSDNFEDLGLDLKMASEGNSNFHGSSTFKPQLSTQIPATANMLPPFALKHTQSAPATSTLRKVQLKRAKSAPSSSLSLQPNGMAYISRSSTGAFSQPALKKSSARQDVSNLSAFYPVPLSSQKRLSGKRTNRYGCGTDLSKVKIQKGVSSTESLRAKLCARASKTFSSIRRRSGRENPAIPPSAPSPLSLVTLPVTDKSRIYTQQESQSDGQGSTKTHDVAQMEYDEGDLATLSCLTVRNNVTLTPLQNQTAELKFFRSDDSCPMSDGDSHKSRKCITDGPLSINVDDYSEDKSVSSSSRSMSSPCISSPIALREGAMVSVDRWFRSAKHPQNSSLICETFENCVTKQSDADENIDHVSQSLHAALIQSPVKSNLPCVVGEESSILLNVASMPETRATKRQNVPLTSLQNKSLTPNSNNQVRFSFGMSIGCRTPSPQVIRDTSMLPVSSLSPPRNIIDLCTSSDALRVRVARPQFRRQAETSQPASCISPFTPKNVPPKFTSFYTSKSLDEGSLSERLSDESLASILITPESTYSHNYFPV